jgi:hypothetical protein
MLFNFTYAQSPKQMTSSYGPNVGKHTLRFKQLIKQKIILYNLVHRS